MTSSSSTNSSPASSPPGSTIAPAEEVLNRLVRLAALALRAPVAYLALVDQDRQLIKNVVGLPESFPRLRDLPLDHFLSNEVIALGGPLAISDLRKDSRAHDVPLVGEGAIALLALPLRLDNGQTMGILGVIDRKPRSWVEEDEAILADLANATLAEIRSRGHSEGLRRTKQALKDSEERFRSLIEHASDLVAIVSAGGTIDYSTPSVERVLGYSPADLVGQNAFSLLHPSDAPSVIGRFARLVRGVQCEGAIDCRVRHKSGSWHMLEVRVSNLLDDPAVVGVVVNAHDITEAREANETQRRLKAFLEATPDFVATFDPHGRALSVNAAFRKLTGIPEGGDLSTLTIADLFPPSVTELILHEGIPAATRAGIWSGETALHGEDGVEIPVSQVILAHKSPNGALEFVSTLARDITERKQAEEALRRSEQHFRSLIENALDIIAILDFEGNVLFESPSIERILGYTPAEMRGRRSFDMIHPEDVGRVVDVFDRGLEDPLLREAVEYRCRHKDGSWRVLESVSENLLAVPAVAGVVVHSRDVTERKAAEVALRESQEQLLQSQKMDAVGRLAGGIAHDFNNLLTAIKGFTELLLLDFDERDPRHPFVTEIQGAANRAAALTRQLLAFSRKQVLQPRVLDLNAAVSDIEKMLRRLIGEDVTLETTLAQRLGRVRADPSQIEQVLVNLAVNARDAMPSGGRILIRTANVQLTEDMIPAHAGVAPGAFVMLALSDTGAGMSPDVQARIFEPFYTTKEKGRGTGLGLSTVYGIVQQSGGMIQVESAIGEGSTFTILLPRVQEEIVAAVERIPNDRPVRGTETVLLAEDEAAVRVLVRRVLDRNGYRVLEAASGAEALKLLEDHPEPVDLLLTDVVMPGMSGRELADQLCLRFPTLRVLYMSGYTDEAIVHHGVLDPGIALLEKPFTPEILLRKIRDILDAPVETPER